jgi:hypothetical protein
MVKRGAAAACERHHLMSIIVICMATTGVCISPQSKLSQPGYRDCRDGTINDMLRYILTSTAGNNNFTQSLRQQLLALSTHLLVLQ